MMIGFGGFGYINKMRGLSVNWNYRWISSWWISCEPILLFQIWDYLWYSLDGDWIWIPNFDWSMIIVIGVNTWVNW